MGNLYSIAVILTAGSCYVKTPWSQKVYKHWWIYTAMSFLHLAKNKNWCEVKRFGSTTFVTTTLAWEICKFLQIPLFSQTVHLWSKLDCQKNQECHFLCASKQDTRVKFASYANNIFTFQQSCKMASSGKTSIVYSETCSQSEKNAQFSQNLMAMPEVVGETVSYMERFISFWNKFIYFRTATNYYTSC